MRSALTIAIVFFSVTIAAGQERSTEGIVLMRVTANVTITLQDGSERQLDDVPIRTGTGTIVSRLGHIVTNAHVVSGGTVKTRIRNVPATVSVNVNRIEACFPPSKLAGTSSCVDASLLASDSELDLAVLSMSGNDFPYVPLGDSDAVKTGKPCEAVGYPLGEDLDVGREAASEGLAPTITGGQVSAVRVDDRGNVRYLQTSAALNPGNSGGPLTDRRGFVIGIVEARVRDAAAIGFAIPVNIVKEFLTRHGVDGFLPSARLTLGYLFDSPEKLIRMQVPPGFEDSARSRLEIDSGSSIPGVSLRIDRVASPWTPQQIENELLQGREFDRIVLTRDEPAVVERRVLRGDAYSQDDEPAQRILYTIVDLGDEKVVARYLGNPEQIAYSESVLAASLAAIETAPMLAATTRTPRDAAWSPVAQPSLISVTPSGWIIDSGAPLPCPIAVNRQSLVTSPPRDFTVSFRVGELATSFDPTQAARECAHLPKWSATDHYTSRFSRFGIEYTVDGRFQPSSSGLLQIEVVAPTQKFPAARELFLRWLAEVSPRGGG